MPKVCESPREWRSPWEGDNSWAGGDRCLQGLLSSKIAEGKNSHSNKCRNVRGHRACLRPCTSSHLEVCGKNPGSMCCCALCGCGYGTWMLQDDRTVLFRSKQVCCMRSADWRDWESESIQNRNKTKSKFYLLYLTYKLSRTDVFLTSS